MSDDKATRLEQGARIYSLNRNRFGSDREAFDAIALQMGLSAESLQIYFQKKQKDADEAFELAVEVLAGYQFTMDTWRPYLECQTSAISEEQKDLAFAILMGCVSDWCQTLQSAASKHIRQKIDSIGTTVAHHSVLNIFAYSTFAAEFMSRLSSGEQVFLNIARDRVVHGYLEGYTKASRNFKVVKPFGEDSSGFEEQKWSRLDQLKLVQDIGNGELWLGVRTLRTKYTAHLSLLFTYLKRMENLPLDEVRAALSTGCLIIDLDLENDYLEFREELNRL